MKDDCSERLVVRMARFIFEKSDVALSYVLTLKVKVFTCLNPLVIGLVDFVRHLSCRK